MVFSSYASKTESDILDEFGVSLESGLPSEEAKRRREKYGRNESRITIVKRRDVFLRQFKSPFIYLLAAAAGLAFIFGDMADGLMIVFFVAVNAGIGFYQEYRSERAAELLKKLIVSRAKVMRDGDDIMIDSAELVPGDIVIVEEGDIMPADVRFLHVKNLCVDESVLSGESASLFKRAVPAKKMVTGIHDAENIGFSGTRVVGGHGTGIVIATGQDAVIGEVSKIVSETERESGFEKGIRRFSRFILRLIVLTLIFVFLANIFIKGSRIEIGEMIIFLIALAVSVIPEALPVVTTFSLSKGALNLARKNKVIVKRLSAIEDLGGIEVLCTDKTGTLTENRLSVSDVFLFFQGSSFRVKKRRFGKKQVAHYAYIASSTMSRKNKKPVEPFDLALWNFVSDEERIKLHGIEKIDEVPFNPESRINSILVKDGETHEIVARGAPESVMKLSKGLKKSDSQKISEWQDNQGRTGHRVMAVAVKRFEAGAKPDLAKACKNLEFLGMISFSDPLKKTAAQAIDKAEKLGVDVKIITGDGPMVAGAVAYETGLVKSPNEVITGDEFEAFGPKDRKEALKKYSVFARVSPFQKFEIIKLLQEDREVGFLGEGINDAAALKLANVAIAVDSASDVAKESADIILLHKSLGAIVDGIGEGRRVFANTVKYIKATLSSNFGNFYAIAIASFIIDFLPMLPLQILLVNLLSDFPMIAVAADNVDAGELKKPQSYNLKDIALISTILGIVSTFFDFVFFALFYKISPAVLHTNWFMGSILTELVFLFSIRTKLPFYKSKKPAVILCFLTILAFFITVFLPFTDLGKNFFRFSAPDSKSLALIFGIVILYFAVSETVKNFYYRWSDKPLR